jgi:hypothetical protein
VDQLQSLLNSAKFLEKREPVSHVAAPGSTAVEDTSGIPAEAATPSAPKSETVAAPATVAGEQESVSPLDALQRKFASHKVTTAGVKVE